MKGIKRLALLLALLVLLAACLPDQSAFETRPIIAPAQMGSSTAFPTKLVTLFPEGTLTQAPSTLVTSTPPRPTYTSPALRPTFTPFSLSDLHVKTATYKDRQAGFAIDYPASWVLSPGIGGDEPVNGPVRTVTLLSNEPSTQPKDPDVPAPGAAKITVSVYKDQLRDLAQAVTDRQAGYQAADPPYKVLHQEEWLLPGGLKAAYFRLETSGGQVDELVAVVQQQMVVVSGSGPLTLFPTIARTLRELR